MSKSGFDNDKGAGSTEVVCARSLASIDVANTEDGEACVSETRSGGSVSVSSRSAGKYCWSSSIVKTSAANCSSWRSQPGSSGTISGGRGGEGEGEEINGTTIELATRPSDTVGVGDDNINEVEIIVTGSTSSKVSDVVRTDGAGMSAARMEVFTRSLSLGNSTTGELPGTGIARLRQTFSFLKARASLRNGSKDTESQVVQELYFLDI